MSARPYRFRQLAILIAAALPATSVWSAGLSAIQVHSFLGQPLLATITLQLHEDENLTLLDCIRTHRANDDLAGPGPLRQELFMSGSQATVYLRGQESLQEPLIGMKISVGCGEIPQLQRSYTLLLDPAPVVERKVTSSAAPPTAPATETTASASINPVLTPATSARQVRSAPTRAKRPAAKVSKPVKAAAIASAPATDTPAMPPYRSSK